MVIAEKSEMSLFLLQCTFVCVCASERERERERKRGK